MPGIAAHALAARGAAPLSDARRGPRARVSCLVVHVCPGGGGGGCRLPRVCPVCARSLMC